MSIFNEKRRATATGWHEKSLLSSMKTTLPAVICLLLILLGLSSHLQAQAGYTINGYVTDGSNGESLINATVADLRSRKGGMTNDYGFFSLTLPADSVNLVVSYPGFATQRFRLKLDGDTTLRVALPPLALDEVEIIAEEAERAVDQTGMSVVSIPVDQIKLMPALLGEVDIVKAIQLMPGVQSGNEGATGLYVRGGSPDQNLVLLDGVPLYYVSHLGGFFSVFNADAISSFNLYKGDFPARYGGRLSSVLDVRMKEGNRKAFEAEGSIGLISSKISVQGPIWKDKTSFIVSGRRTYLDLLTRPIVRLASEGQASAGYYFYDLNGKINHTFSEKDRLFFSFYAGDDKAFGKFNENPPGSDRSRIDIDLVWGNRMGALRWNHLWSKNLFSNLTTTYTRYRLRTGGKSDSRIDGQDQLIEFAYTSYIQDWGAKLDFDYYPTPNHSIKFGVNSTYHTFEPGAITLRILDELSDIDLDTTLATQQVGAWENAAYLEDDIQIGRRFSANLGLYAAHYLVNETNFFSLQPRASARFMASPDVAIKASYSRATQFLHLLTNNGLGLPIDLWVPATEKVPPQQSWQVAAGVSASLFDDMVEASIEGYYKEMNNLITFKEGTNFILDAVQRTGWEETVETPGFGQAYGAEFLLQKKQGRTTGWIGYTLSWNWRQFDRINDGERYPFRYDRRHDLAVVVIHQLSDQLSLSGNWVYGTGNAISLPSAGYLNIPGSREFGAGGYENGFIPFGTGGLYGNPLLYENGINGFRMQHYHRLDIGMSYTYDMAWGTGTWNVSLYNAYSRLNPYAYYFDSEYNIDTQTSEIKLKKLALFPIIPSVSWSFRF